MTRLWSKLIQNTNLLVETSIVAFSIIKISILIMWLVFHKTYSDNLPDPFTRGDFERKKTIKFVHALLCYNSNYFMKTLSFLK